MGMNDIPNPVPIIRENVKNKNSTPVAKELSPKPRVAINAPHIMIRRYPYRLHKMLPIKPEKWNKDFKTIETDSPILITEPFWQTVWVWGIPGNSGAGKEMDWLMICYHRKKLLYETF